MLMQASVAVGAEPRSSLWQALPANNAARRFAREMRSHER